MHKELRNLLYMLKKSLSNFEKTFLGQKDEKEHKGGGVGKPEDAGQLTKNRRQVETQIQLGATEPTPNARGKRKVSSRGSWAAIWAGGVGRARPVCTLFLQKPKKKKSWSPGPGQLIKSWEEKKRSVSELKGGPAQSMAIHFLKMVRIRMGKTMRSNQIDIGKKCRHA